LCNHVLSGLTEEECIYIFYSHSLFSYLNAQYGTMLDSKSDCFLDLWTIGRGEARMGYRRHNWKLVASEFWTTSISVRAAAHHKTERTQETISRAAARERYNDKNRKSFSIHLIKVNIHLLVIFIFSSLCCTEELQISRRTVIRIIR